MSDQHHEDIGALLSGYIDGELTQQQRQRVERLCEEHSEYAQALEELRSLRHRVGSAELSTTTADQWRENIDDRLAGVTRGFGWLLLAGGVLLFAAWWVYQLLFVSAAPLLLKLFVALFYGGFALLFLSVLRQRLLERKTDKYEDVEI